MTAYADEVFDPPAALRRRRAGRARSMTDEMASLMIGDAEICERVARVERGPEPGGARSAALHASDDDAASPATPDRPQGPRRRGSSVSPLGRVTASRNWAEVPPASADLDDGRILKSMATASSRCATRGPAAFKLLAPGGTLCGTPAVPRMTVAENIAFVNLRRGPDRLAGWWLLVIRR